jgi:sulfite reductase alpha subunit-like flavoprotein
MTALWNALLRADLPADLLDHLDIAVFGIGDSSYERFCWASKKLHRRLLALGAHQILDRADADEQHYLGFVCITIYSLEAHSYSVNQCQWYT